MTEVKKRPARSPAPAAAASAVGDRRVRILCFVAKLSGGGAEKHLVRVLHQLDPARYVLRLVVVRGGGTYEGELPAHVELRVLRVPRLLAAVGSLRRELREFAPDLVYSLMDEPSLVMSLALRAARSRARFVVSVQNSYERMTGPHASGARRLTYRLLPWFYRRVDALVAISRGVAQDIARMSPRLAARTRVIYNAGYDDETLALAARAVPLPEVPAGHRVVVACGRLTLQKGFTHLLGAFAQVSQAVPSVLWLVGTGELEAELRERARALGIDDRVEFLGFRGNPYAVMRRGDVFVLSSLWEGFGNVIVEAMAVGTPVVASDCPHGPGEIIEEGASGLLVPPADEAALATAVLRVLRDPALAERLRQAGLARSRAFSGPSIGGEYAAAFRDVLGAGGA